MHPIYGCHNRSRGPFGAGYAKCNLFVAEVLANIGLYTASHGESGWRLLTLRIPTASDWANDRVPGFNRTSYPKPGSIVAEKYDGYRDATGHVGIVVDYGQTVGTNAYLEGRLCKNDFGFRTDPDLKDKPCGGHKDNVIYLDYRNATSGLHTIIPDDILDALNA
ncbi:MAG: CHAP domain-containing protein [Candidatus Cardinium sp.]|uniref:CHAP domain-containing protein n=1 Tax=Cardinium endosymbiont of Dermatophagoides farinae TaxID=2597823 RepID=UPI001642FB39|nr:CHAP domain-containing protein [Cardinium endosymbiont of Dermatophagoides farinae]UWW97426.1 MAG: CHAP domain-containing protein [Candidatus Cardinium sp.]